MSEKEKGEEKGRRGKKTEEDASDRLSKAPAVPERNGRSLCQKDQK